MDAEARTEPPPATSTDAAARARADWSFAKIACALLGAPLAAYAIAAALIAFLPLAPPSAFAIGAHAFVPLWVAFGCALPLARSGRAALAICTSVVVPLGLALFLRSMS